MEWAEVVAKEEEGEICRMKRRIVIPTEDQAGKVVADHFGRAPFFAVFEIDHDGNITSKEVNPNQGEHAGGRGHAHNNIMRYSPSVIIVKGMGPRGLRSFQTQNVAVLRANSPDADKVMESFKQQDLQELTDGCQDAHHK